ncbi:hypothetical protein [Erythrobacter donghaensis]|uniref:hypothetical protein n=1 Tax=Erythrobacter donghaensis TaxID=267135 RepID=UPI00117E1BE4|nr:hypothetical protein [Erythrobacter donghaensis]
MVPIAEARGIPLLKPALAFVLITAVSASPVLAQVSDNASVDAIATLEESALPLTVTGINALNFGTVRIPNRSRDARSCQYDIAANGSATMTIEEVDISNGQVIDSLPPTPSNCDNSGSFSPARFEVSCNPATPTFLLYEFDETALSLTPGVVFTLSNDENIVALNRGETGSGFASAFDQTLAVTCPEGNETGQTAGEFDVVLGGRLTVGVEAIAQGNLTLSTLTLTASY